MPATRADIRRKKEDEKNLKARHDKQKLVILMEGASRYITGTNKGALIGRTDPTLRARLNNIGTCTLDELAAFLAWKIVAPESIYDAVLSYLNAAADAKQTY